MAADKIRKKFDTYKRTSEGGFWHAEGAASFSARCKAAARNEGQDSGRRGYSVGNLDGLMQLARLGENVGVDLWNYKSADGRSIRRALDYLIPFAIAEAKWPYQQLGEWPPQMLFPLLRRAVTKYEDGQFAGLLVKLPKVEATDRTRLLTADQIAGKQALR